jgi:hypothetical protein
MQKSIFFILLIVVIGCSAWACNTTAQNQAPAKAVNSQNSTEPERQNSNDEKALQPSPTKTPPTNRLETRCGWFVNPTPANASLLDRDGEWIIGVQGGYQAEGDYPDFKPEQWVETNVHYGYGCACLRVKVDYENRKILEIKSSSARELSVCRKDRSLKEPK